MSELPLPVTQGLEGMQAAGGSVQASSSAACNKPRGRFTLLKPRDLPLIPQASFAIDGVLPMQGIACVYGASQAGKSALMLSMVDALARGVPWFGRVTRCLRVCYLALEGAPGLVQRVEALQTHSGQELPDSVRFVFDEFSLKSDVDELCHRIKKVGGTDVVIIDTLFCAMAGEDENSSHGMWQAIAGAKALQQSTGGLVIMVHHTGKDAGRGMRGHSSLNAAVDAAIEVQRHDDFRSWRLVKSRDSEDNCKGSFALQTVDLPSDIQGHPRGSVVAVSVDTEEVAEPTRQLRKNQAAALNALRSTLGDEEDDSIEPSAALELVKDAMDCDHRHRKQRAQEALEGLRKLGLLQSDDDGRLSLTGTET